MELEIEIVRSDRKTVSLEIDKDGKVKLRVPQKTSKADIDKIVSSKRDWIKKHIAKQRETNKTDYPSKKLTSDELKELAENALKYIPPRANHFAAIMKVSFNRITIRNQKTRWGSCSGLGNLNFNCLMMLMPECIRDYIIVHELCHLKEMNHSQKFWHEVSLVIPDYKEKEKWLKDNGKKFILLLE